MKITYREAVRAGLREALLSDPRVFLMYEQYRDKAAFEEHGQTEHFKEIALGELFPLLESRERNFYETL